jgi:hypothetical protein
MGVRDRGDLGVGDSDGATHALAFGDDIAVGIGGNGVEAQSAVELTREEHVGRMLIDAASPPKG